MEKIICFFTGHLWIEWSHDNERPRSEYYPRTAVLINPECARCGVRMFKTEREAIKNHHPLTKNIKKKHPKMTDLDVDWMN